jgi:hypothetical protein
MIFSVTIFFGDDCFGDESYLHWVFHFGVYYASHVLTYGAGFWAQTYAPPSALCCDGRAVGGYRFGPTKSL